MSAPTKLIQHPSSSALVRYQQAGVTYEPTAKTTPSDLAILKAINGRKVNEAKDAELDMVLIRNVNAAVLLLGQKNQWQNENDQRLLVNELYRLIRQKYGFYTLNEVELIFQLGMRGELKQKPTDVVFLNIEQVSGWFRIFKNDTRAKAIGTCKRLEESPKAEVPDMKQDLKAAVELAGQGVPLPPLTLIMLQAVYYEKFEAAGLIALTIEQKKAIYLEERQRELNRAKSDMANRTAEKKFAFNLFRQAVEALAPLTDANPFESRVKGNCRERVFTGALQALAASKTDIDTLPLWQPKS